MHSDNLAALSGAEDSSRSIVWSETWYDCRAVGGDGLRMCGIRQSGPSKRDAHRRQQRHPGKRLHPYYAIVDGIQNVPITDDTTRICRHALESPLIPCRTVGSVDGVRGVDPASDREPIVLDSPSCSYRGSEKDL